MYLLSFDQTQEPDVPFNLKSNILDLRKSLPLIENALKFAKGDLILFQDADLEYHPENFPNLINPFLNHSADVVYGSRLTGAKITKILVRNWFWENTQYPCTRNSH